MGGNLRDFLNRALFFLLGIFFAIAIERLVGSGWSVFLVAFILVVTGAALSLVYRIQSISVLWKLVIGGGIFLFFMALGWLILSSDLLCQQISRDQITVSASSDAGNMRPDLSVSRELLIPPESQRVTISVDVKNQNGEFYCVWTGPYGEKSPPSECKKVYNIMQVKDQRVVNIEIFAQDCQSPIHEYVVLVRASKEN